MGGRTDAERIVKLALYVKKRPKTTFAAIRDALPADYGPESGTESAARRRFERDKESLREYGVFFTVGNEGEYTIDADRSYAMPVDLTADQASLLRLLCDALLKDGDYPFKNELRMILAKIGDEIDVPDLLPSMESTRRRTAGRPPTGLAKARRAIENRKRLSFEYRDAQGEATTREVEPFGCFLLHGSCYIVAFDPDAGGDRVFRLDRMRRVHVNPKSPQEADFPAREFDAARYYGLPFQFGDEDGFAQVAFDAENAWRAARLCMDQGSFEKDGDDGLMWSVRCRDARALASWCVENGPGIAPLEPEKAHEAFEQGLRSLISGTGAGEGAGE